MGSACTALHFSQTQQSSIIIAVNNPYHFPSGGVQSFTVGPAMGSDDDQLMYVIKSANCSSQWTVNLDPVETLPTRICGIAPIGSAIDMSDGVSTCPNDYTFGVQFAGNFNDSCDIDLGYSPWGAGSGSDFVYQLKLTGSGSGSSGITVTPPSINFGDVQINTNSAAAAVTVKNNSGSAGTSVTGGISGAPFLVSPNPASFGLPPSGSASFNVTCMPTTTGQHNGSIDFDTGASMGTTTLTCNGINSTVNISPSQVTFDPTLVGRPPMNKNVMISSSNGAATIDSVTLDTDATNAGVTIASNPQGMPIGGGKTVVLAYSAAAMHAAGPLGVLTIDTSVEGPRNVPISGEALLGGVGTNPSSIDFGPVCAGDTATEDVEVYANEPGSIVLMSITPPAAPFGAMPVDSLPKPLAGNHSGPSATIRVTVTPTIPGELADTLVLATNVPMKPTTELDITATALAGGIAATPTLVSFGTADVGATTSIKQVELTNCGTTDLMFDRANISGSNATEFTLIGNNASKTLAPTESEVFLVVMQPRTAGIKTATLNIHHSAGTTTAALDGTATGGEEKERETYYACSTGRGAGWWPIVFALLALRRRRR